MTVSCFTLYYSELLKEMFLSEISHVADMGMEVIIYMYLLVVVTFVVLFMLLKKIYLYMENNAIK